ncbi:MAG TPA: LacI family DNA-binding transcriptional regulator [Armatimonadota bacterium]|nr:LacI family DNA-binding transcriptional regulator [Armatimonadota bacterium]
MQDISKKQLENASRSNIAGTSVTLQEVAQRCGLALSTVSLALRHDPRVRCETTERICRVAEEMGYDPSLHENARRLALIRYGKTPSPNNVVAIFCPHDFLKVTFHLRIFKGFSDRLMVDGYGVLTGYINEEPGKRTPVPFLPMFSRGFVDGLFSLTGYGMEYYSDKLRSLQGFGTRPILVFQRDCNRVSPITLNDELAGYLTARHLLDIGHRHILHFSYAPQDDGSLQPVMRISGVQRALREFGLDPEQHLHFLPYWRPWHTPMHAPQNLTTHAALSRKATQVKRSLLSYLREHPEVTGIIALNDPYALNIWYTLHEAGYRVPQDYSIVGFDDTDGMYDASGLNLLTTVRFPLEDIGTYAAELILQQIRNEGTEIVPKTINPEGMIIRHSTAPPTR